MKPLVSFICLAGLLAACGGPEDRPVSEELSLEEINTLLKKNPDFQEAVNMAERFRFMAPTVEMARANDLSYEELQEFLDESTDDRLRERLQNEARTEWTTRYGAAAAQVPGLITHWHDYLDSLRPERYVSVRLLATDPGESIYGAARVTLEFAPTRGTINRLKGRFGLFPRNREHGFDDFSIARHNDFDFPQGINGPTRITTRMQYSIWDIADGDIGYNMYPDRPGLPIDALLEKYEFDYAVFEVVVNGREVNFSEIYEQVPQSIRDYWNKRDEEHPEREEELMGDIARELIMPDFVCGSRFIHRYEEEYFRSRDSLAAWFVLDHNLTRTL